MASAGTLHRGFSARNAERISRWLLAALLVLSPLALGSLHTESLAVCVVFASIAALLAFVFSEPLQLRPSARIVMGTSLLLLFWTALQIVPLPIFLVRILSPEAADTWSRSLSPLHEDGPAYVTLSLDPIATRVQLVRGISYVLVLVAALRASRAREGTRFLLRALVLAGVVMALISLAHPAVGAHRVFGAYAPLDAATFAQGHLGPLLNTNHLAAFSNIGLCVAIGSLLAPRHPAMPRSFALGAALLLLAVTLWTASRGGVAAAAVGIVVTFIATRASSGADRKTLFISGAALVMVLGGVVMAAISVNDDVITKITGGDFSKLKLFGNSLALLGKFPLFGVGRGAFESVFPSVREGTDYWVFTNPENLPLQWTTEWGVPVGIFSIAALSYALLPRTPLARSHPPIGAWGALVCALLHNMVDFSAETPGVMYSLVVCAAVCVGGTGGQTPDKPSRWTRALPRVPIVLAVIGVPLALFCAINASRELGADQRALRKLALESSSDKEGFHVAVRAAMLRHPGEPYLPYAGALRAATARDEPVIPWAARVLERSPIFGRVHLLLARSLFVRSPAQARLEYRLAYAEDSQLSSIIDRECLPLVTSYEDALELAPDGPKGAALLAQIAESTKNTLPATQIRLDDEVLRRDPTATAPLEHQVEASLRDVSEDAPWCEANKKACADEGLLRADRLVGARPGSCRSWELRSRMMAAAGDPKRALDELATAVEKVDDRAACARTLVQVSLEMNQGMRADLAIDRLSKIGCATQTECESTMAFIATTEDQRHNGRKAIFYYKRAMELAPDQDPYLQLIARDAEANNLHGEAIDAYGKLARRHPSDPQWTEKQRVHEEAVKGEAIDSVKAPTP